MTVTTQHSHAIRVAEMSTDRLRPLADLLAGPMAEGSDRIAVIDDRNRWTRYEVAARVTAARRWLRAVGVVPGSVVTVQLPNWAEAYVITQAVLGLGGVVNPVTPIYRSSELRFIMLQARPTVAVIPHRFRGYDYLRSWLGMRDELPSPPNIVVVRPEGDVRGSGVATWDQMLHAGEEQPDPAAPASSERVDPDDTCLLLYTSGTSADPKGVLHSRRTISAECRAVAEAYGLGPEDSFFTPSPIGHVTGMTFGVLLPMMTGATSVLMPQWEPRRALEIIEAERCRFCLAATPFLEGLIAAYREHDSTSSLHTFLCGGADVTPRLIREGTEALGAFVARAYGSTEVPTAAYSTPGDSLAACAQTDGRPGAGCQVRLDSAEHEHDGELLVRAPEMFKGYLDADHDAEAFTADGFFRTGDRARIEPDGRIVILGRSKDVVIRLGENISAREVEQVVREHPGVAEVAVVAVPDPRTGERGCAFVVPVPGACPGVAELRAWFRNQEVAMQKTPEQVIIVDRLPLNPTGKIDKRALRSMVAAHSQDETR